MTEEKKHLPLWQESILLVAIALFVAFIVKTFFVQAFYIPSASMEPTLREDDRVLVQKISYWRGEPSRGDLVVFADPGGWLDASQSRQASGFVQNTLARIGLFPTGGHLIKRVVAVGGDVILCCDAQGRIMVNGEPIDEPYVADAQATAEHAGLMHNHDTPNPECDEWRDAVPTCRWAKEVPPRRLWVLGDNRAHSADSRSHRGEPGDGFVSVDLVVGKAWLRVWPWDRIGGMRSTDAFDNVPDR